MSIEEFINENRDELVGCIRNGGGRLDDNDDEEIEMWVMNDEGLYNWAMDAGVEEI